MVSQRMRIFVTASFLAGGLYVFAIAPRKVTIPVENTGSTNALELLNGSSVNVNYRIQCYNKAGASTFTKTGLSLTPKQKRRHAGIEACGNGNTGWTSSNAYSGMIYCSESGPQSGAASVCGSGYTVCSHSEFVSRSSGMSWTGWVTFSQTFGAGAGSWSWENYTGGWNNNSAGEAPLGAPNPGNTCNTSAMGAGSTVTHCLGGAQATSSWGTYCCDTPATEKPSDSCVVEIESSTSQDGFLQSPQFKGGAAF